MQIPFICQASLHRVNNIKEHALKNSQLPICFGACETNNEERISHCRCMSTGLSSSEPQREYDKKMQTLTEYYNGIIQNARLMYAKEKHDILEFANGQNPDVVKLKIQEAGKKFISEVNKTGLARIKAMNELKQEFAFIFCSKQN